MGRPFAAKDAKANKNKAPFGKKKIKIGAKSDPFRKKKKPKIGKAAAGGAFAGKKVRIKGQAR